MSLERPNRIRGCAYGCTPENIDPACLAHREKLETAPSPTRQLEPRDFEKYAKQFHEAYERLAPSFGYETRKASNKPWSEVPENNRRLMIAVCKEVVEPITDDLETAIEECNKTRKIIFAGRQTEPMDLEAMAKHVSDFIFYHCGPVYRTEVLKQEIHRALQQVDAEAREESRVELERFKSHADEALDRMTGELKAFDGPLCWVCGNLMEKKASGGWVCISCDNAYRVMKQERDALRVEYKECLETLRQTKSDWDEALRWKKELDQARAEVERLQATMADIQTNPPPSPEQWHAVCDERDFLKAWVGAQFSTSDFQSADEMRAALDKARSQLAAMQNRHDSAIKRAAEYGVQNSELKDACNFLREARIETEGQLVGQTKERREAEEDSRRFAEQNAALRAALVECRARLEFLSFLGENDVLERADKALGLSQP